MDDFVGKAPKQSAAINPITAEIIRHALLSIPNQIDVNITRTAYSPLIYEYKDYAVGIVDHEGRLISQAQGGIPLFVANALGVAVRDGMEVHGKENIRSGDVLFSNHATTLGQHLNNVVMYTPIFVGKDDEELFGFMAVLVHWLDIGGRVVGSCATSGSTDIFQEGIQFRSVKLRARGEPVRDMYRMIEYNTRFPRMLLGDVESQLAGCLLGRDMIVALLEKYGLETTRAAIALMWERSDKSARQAIAALPDGDYHADALLDNDSIDLDKNILVDAIVRIRGEEMTVDFSGTSDQVKGPLNSGRDGGAVAAARIAFKYLVAPDDPPNDGSFRALKVEIPEGKFISATGNAPMGGYSTPMPTVVDTVVKAMVSAAPQQVAAGHHGNFGINSYSGIDPRTGELFQCMGTLHGGWGASLGHDGPGPYKTMSHGDTLDYPIEVQEALYPVHIDYQLIRPDTGGAGEFRGGCGLEKLTTLLAPCTTQIFFDRTVCPPWGILGGKEGATPSLVVERKDGSKQSVLKGFVQLQPGDQVRVRSGGGGGYGDAAKRAPDRVARDVRLGYVSREGASEFYGVALDDRLRPLEVETTELRGKMGEGRKPA